MEVVWKIHKWKLIGTGRMKGNGVGRGRSETRRKADKRKLKRKTVEGNENNGRNGNWIEKTEKAREVDMERKRKRKLSGK